MSYGRTELLVNVDTRSLIKSTTQLVSPTYRPRFVYADTLILAVHFVDADGADYVLHANDTFDVGLDKDFVRLLDEGTADAGYSGAVTSIVVNGLTETIPDTGHIVLINGSGESDRIAYTAHTAGTFTVDDTLTYTYLEGDEVQVEDELMAYSDDTQVDVAGDWADIDRASGKISIRINCLTDAFSRKIASAASNGELLSYLQIRRVPNGESAYTTMLQDYVYTYAAVIGAAGDPGQTVAGYLTQTAADARYVQGPGNLTNAGRLTKVSAANTITEATIAEGSITGLLTLAKSGTTARTATFPDAAITVAGANLDNVFSVAQTFRAASAVRSEAAATQDAVILAGRAGGTGSYAVAITPTTLSASRTATLPDASIVVAGSAASLTDGRLPRVTTGGLLQDTDITIGASTGIISRTGALIFQPSTSSVFGDSAARTYYTISPALQVSSSGAGPSSGVFFRHATGAAGHCSRVIMGVSRGAAGTPTIVQSGDKVGELIWIAADGAGYDSAVAIIKAEVDGTPGAGDMPGRLIFSTTADGAAAVTDRMRLNSSGQLLIAATSPIGSEKLYVNGASVLGDISVGAADGIISRAGAVTIQTTTATSVVLGTNSVARYTITDGAVAVTQNSSGVSLASGWLYTSNTKGLLVYNTSAAAKIGIQLDGSNIWQIGETYPINFQGGNVKINASGQVLINAAAAIGSEKLYVAGQTRLDQTSSTGAVAPLVLKQADVDEPAMRVIGTASAASVANTLVAVADVSTATVAGYVQIYVEDLGDQIADGKFYVAVHSLT